MSGQYPPGEVGRLQKAAGILKFRIFDFLAGVGNFGELKPGTYLS